MAHNAGKVLMGMTRSSFRHAEPRKGSIAAGTIVRLKSDGTITTAKADGEALGISLGKDLSNIGYTSIVKSGTAVPILLTNSFNPAIGAQVQIDDVTGLAKAAGAGVTGVNAVYVSNALTAILEDGTEAAAKVALIEMPGGL